MSANTAVCHQTATRYQDSLSHTHILTFPYTFYTHTHLNSPTHPYIPLHTHTHKHIHLHSPTPTRTLIFPYRHLHVSGVHEENVHVSRLRRRTYTSHGSGGELTRLRGT